jgi:hypothetical protein
MKLQHGNAVEITSSFIVENNATQWERLLSVLQTILTFGNRFRLRDAMRTS